MKPETIWTLTPAEFAFCKRLPEGERGLFVNADTNKRSKMQKGAANRNPVLYTVKSGEHKGLVIRKSAGQELAEMHEDADTLRKQLADNAAEKLEKQFEDKAEKLLKHLPGTPGVLGKLLRAAEAIGPDAVGALKANNTSMSKAFETVGYTGEAEPGTPDDDMRRIEDDYMHKHNVKRPAAVGALSKADTPEGERYAAAYQLQKAERPAGSAQ